MSSESLYKESRELFPGGVNSPVRFYEPYPRFIMSASGSKIYDADGREYVDHCLAFGPLILGHGNQRVKKALQAQMERGILFGAPSEGEIQLGKAIREAIPSIEMMRFTNSGTEATMHALRLARHHTGRDLILKISGGFHGAHDMALSAAPYKPDTDPAMYSTLEIAFNDIPGLEMVFRNLGQRIAAFITEPVLGNVGVVPPDPEFLKASRELTSDSGSILIFDEVITGFRSSYGGYQDMVGVKPDMTTLGKIIGGGLPVGMFGGRRDIMEDVAPSGTFYQQGTFSGSPLAMAAGYATLQELKNADYNGISSYVTKLGEEVSDFAGQRGIDIQFNRSGTMFTVFFNNKDVTDAASAMRSRTDHYTQFFNSILNNGIFIPKSQFEACFTSSVHTLDDLGKVVEASRNSLRSIS
ncbi:MAG: glutamate-1-semialdehyde 2,1-aminomutase [Candidatus Thermoplasmatota archaeon]|nr:glutamate-1-semialdehyde 2,1-aminomutase [Candidatus Thermoplasmatota archaeon]